MPYKFNNLDIDPVAVDLWRRHQNGDSAARGLLAIHYIKVVRILSRRWAARYGAMEQYDDLVGVGFVALMRSIDGYDPQRGQCKFTSYLCPALLHEFIRWYWLDSRTVKVPLDALKAGGSTARICSPPEEMFVSRGEAPTIYSERMDDLRLTRAQLGVALAGMGASQRQIILDHFIRGRTFRAIAKDRGVSHQAIAQAVRGALRAGKKALGLDAGLSRNQIDRLGQSGLVPRGKTKAAA